MIRDEGVKTLSGTMKENTTLTTLDLARVEEREWKEKKNEKNEWQSMELEMKEQK